MQALDCGYSGFTVVGSTGSGGYVGQGRNVGAAVCARKHLDTDGLAVLVVIVQEKCMRGHVRPGVINKTGAALTEYDRQAHPLCGQQRPWSHRYNDGVGFDDVAINFNASHGCVVGVPHRACDSSTAQSGAMPLGSLHHRGGEHVGMNDCRRLGRAKSRRYDDAVGQPL